MFSWLTRLFVDESEARIAQATLLDFRRSLFVAKLRADVGIGAVRGVVAALFADVPDLALRIEDEPTESDLPARPRARTTQREADHLLQWFLGKHELSAFANALVERNWDSFPALLRVPVEELIAETRASGVDAERWRNAMLELHQRYAVAAKSTIAAAATSSRVDVGSRLLSYDDDDDDESTFRSGLQGAVG
jgi:hypothetical protein